MKDTREYYIVRHSQLSGIGKTGLASEGEILPVAEVVGSKDKDGNVVDVDRLIRLGAIEEPTRKELEDWEKRQSSAAVKVIAGAGEGANPEALQTAAKSTGNQSELGDASDDTPVQTPEEFRAQLVGAVGDKPAASLLSAGYDSADKIIAAVDGDLVKVADVKTAEVTKLRAAFKAE